MKRAADSAEGNLCIFLHGEINVYASNLNVFLLGCCRPCWWPRRGAQHGPTAVRFWCNTGTLQDWNNNMTICVQKTCHSALKQLVLRESYGAEIVNSMAVGGREGKQHLSSTVSVSERLILKHTMEYLCMWMQCCHFLSDRSYQATLRWYDVMCSVYSIFQMKALWTSPYINTHYHVLTPSLSLPPPTPRHDRGNLARHSLLTQRKQIEGK